MKQIPIGNSDYNGFVRVDKVFHKMPLGNGQVADFFFKFSSDPRQEPKYMGVYWTIPFFDTNVIKTVKNRYVWKSPNHGTYTFNNSPTADKGFTETYVLNTTGKWKLNVLNDETIWIQYANDPKNKFIFKNGKLNSFCIGEGSDTFRVSYTGKGFPQSIYNVSKHASEMEFVYDKDGLTSKIVFPRDKKALFITYGACDTFASDGITKQGQSLKSVSSIIFVDGSKEEYKYFAESSKKERKILSRKEGDNSVQVSVNKFVQTAGEKRSEGFIEWDATTGLIIYDSGGEYAVRNPLFDKYNPEKEDKEIAADRKLGKPTQESRISYKKPEHKYAEIWGYSIRNAIKTTQNPNTGELTRTSYIGNLGNASMEVRKIEKRLPGDSEWKLFLAKAYNDKGNLIREIDGARNIFEFVHQGDKQNGTYTELINGNKSKFEKHKDGKKIYEMRKVENDIYESVLSDDLITIKKNGEKINEYKM